MSRYNEDLDYLILDVDISKEECEKIIAETDKIISNANSDMRVCIDAYLKKAQCLQKLKKDVDSKGVIDKLLELNPNMHEALVRLGVAYISDKVKDDKDKNYDVAIGYIKRAIAANANYAVAYYFRGWINYLRKEYGDAIKDYNEAIRLNPKYAQAYWGLGCAKFMLWGEEKDAIKDYGQAIRIKPKYAQAYDFRGYVKYWLEEYDDAIDDFTKAISIKPNSNLAYYYRGNAILKSEKYNDTKEKYNDAINDYSKAIEIDSDFTEAHKARGNAYVEIKKYEEAAEDFHKAKIDIWLSA